VLHRPVEPARHIVLFVLLIGFDVIALFQQTREEIAGVLHMIVPAIHVTSISNLLPALSLLTYILICEGSMWFMRARAKLSLHILDRLQIKYKLEPREQMLPAVARSSTAKRQPRKRRIFPQPTTQ
jgi:hypothetical protein